MSGQKIVRDFRRDTTSFFDQPDRLKALIEMRDATGVSAPGYVVTGTDVDRGRFPFTPLFGPVEFLSCGDPTRGKSNGA